ncbi:MAG: hypothetical protein A2261_02060 [Candidatus Magasanikbacteria bacterium RIFOXYA2_FULL_44_8]|uniref:Uncharacterized protein n=1 Tax=Candidatus Magasanikbacteria bacterium RIFOXYA2_FULL_44_8 TaxID=1798696 RepID=A0A1F6NLC7_9BACT|nr:MAG: hypothetical protein A2261_02060 [Candidatus Magasanikbacteria bacterium RIFOXYA2_FULL_44_8]
MKILILNTQAPITEMILDGNFKIAKKELDWRAAIIEGKRTIYLGHKAGFPTGLVTDLFEEMVQKSRAGDSGQDLRIEVFSKSSREEITPAKDDLLLFWDGHKVSEVWERTATK